MELLGQYTSWIEDLRSEVEEKNRKLEEKNLVMNKLSKENDKYNSLTEKTNKKKDGKPTILTWQDFENLLFEER